MEKNYYELQYDGGGSTLVPFLQETSFKTGENINFYFQLDFVRLVSTRCSLKSTDVVRGRALKFQHDERWEVNLCYAVVTFWNIS